MGAFIDYFGGGGGKKAVVEYGMLFNEVDGNGNPLDVLMNLNCDIGSYQFGRTGAMSGDKMFLQTKVFKIVANAIASNGFDYFLHKFSGKLKLDVASMDKRSFGGLGAGATTAPKVWISKKCITIAGSSNYGTPWVDCNGGTKIYCEAASKPSGWNVSWNYSGSTAHSVSWGVTEKAFDAL